MNCTRCDSALIMSVSGKISSPVHLRYGCDIFDGDIPASIGIGYADDITFKYCLDCGQIQDKFPIDEDVLGDIAWDYDGNYC